MKKWMFTLITACLATTVAAAPTRKGVYEARVEAIADFADVYSAAGLPVRGAFGYYLGENLQVGACVQFAKLDVESYWGKDDLWGLGLYGEFNIDWDALVLPYVGLTAGFFDGDADDDTALVLTVSPGAKVFLTETVALSVHVNWNVSNEGIYDFKRDFSASTDTVSGEGKTSSFSGAIAIRFLFY